MPAPRPRHARAIQANKWPIARATPAPRPRHCPVTPGFLRSGPVDVLWMSCGDNPINQNAPKSVKLDIKPGWPVTSPVYRGLLLKAAAAGAHIARRAQQDPLLPAHDPVV
eukprot:gene23194-biopygen13356